MSPEAIGRRRFTVKSDVWAFGVTLWEFFDGSGNIPYILEVPEDTQLHAGLLAGLRLPCPPACPPAVYAIMQRCWAAGPAERPGFDELHRDLRQAFRAEFGALPGCFQAGAQAVACEHDFATSDAAPAFDTAAYVLVRNALFASDVLRQLGLCMNMIQHDYGTRLASVGVLARQMAEHAVVALDPSLATGALDERLATLRQRLEQPALLSALERLAQHGHRVARALPDTPDAALKKPLAEAVLSVGVQLALRHHIDARLLDPAAGPAHAALHAFWAASDASRMVVE